MAQKPSERLPARAVGAGRALTAQERLFAHEYLVDRNGTQAAIRAGYSARSAHTLATRLLQKVAVRRLIDASLKRITERTEVSVERIVAELYRILTADPVEALTEDGGVKPLREWPEDLRRALSGMEVEELFAGKGEEREQIGRVVKMKWWSKTEASSQLLRKLGAFQDKVLHEAGPGLADLIAAGREAKK